MIDGIDHGVIFAARIFLAPLFLIFGWRKVKDYSGTIDQMVRDGIPTPVPAVAVAIFMELPVAFAVAVGAFTRPAAMLRFSTPRPGGSGSNCTSRPAERIASTIFCICRRRSTLSC